MPAALCGGANLTCDGGSSQTIGYENASAAGLYSIYNGGFGCSYSFGIMSDSAYANPGAALTNGTTALGSIQLTTLVGRQRGLRASLEPALADVGVMALT